MKRNVLFAVAFFATLSASAQSIAAVSPSNATTMYQTLDDAVTKAAPGSIIYLPGGGFNISDDTKITKKITIMGVSHRADADNADGATAIAGNLNFVGESSGSSVIGVYVSGDIIVGDEADLVTNLTIRYCNIRSIQVKHKGASGMVIDQNYLRSTSFFCQSDPIISNNIVHSLYDIYGGQIINNIIVSYSKIYGGSGSYGSWYYTQAIGADACIITRNVLLDPASILKGSECMIYRNMLRTEWGEECVALGNEVNWDDVFTKNKGVNIFSDYHFTDDYKKYEDIGIYGGSGFNPNKSLAPIPRIVSKKVNEHTDGSGMLHIEVKVKAD